MTTLKWLVLDPYNSEHSSLHVGRDGVASGWFVLSDQSWRGLGKCGEIHLRLAWRHAHGAEPPPSHRQTALEQLSMNSTESALRLGNPAGVQAMLSSLPYLLHVRRITLREVEFFVKDLFMGHKGQAEAGKQQDRINVALLEINRKFEPKDPADPGLTIWDFLVRFFAKQAFPQVLDLRRPGPLAAFMRQAVEGIHSHHMGFWFAVHTSHMNFWQNVAEQFKGGGASPTSTPAPSTPAAPAGEDGAAAEAPPAETPLLPPPRSNPFRNAWHAFETPPRTPLRARPPSPFGSPRGSPRGGAAKPPRPSQASSWTEAIPLDQPERRERLASPPKAASSRASPW
ncbi:hypothetical protein EMIHUDRAFT_439663 [Emiliania huxleyi CCMP1516]|uniref:Uncharacterized protein n=3 Tax=Emiliania huxleyi TaxID=2903 RepID=A0A0D3KX77_EMIH1|nr:hypothetical protein EMIHUDRAFT_439663 [Emiliania huxleyi CCMP1516]EOD40362.1 hypothetical protein EMIHUDRAFT_439663 [Emiliania huxleyi CCMP1516]|eukprot:XP_005792791.1 hypothetical protein EMIHUDRAFT_439663 [Emiliania huxleyi CCMP1516]